MNFRSFEKVSCKSSTALFLLRNSWLITVREQQQKLFFCLQSDVDENKKRNVNKSPFQRGKNERLLCFCVGRKGERASSERTCSAVDKLALSFSHPGTLFCCGALPCFALETSSPKATKHNLEAQLSFGFRYERISVEEPTRAPLIIRDRRVIPVFFLFQCVLLFPSVCLCSGNKFFFCLRACAFVVLFLRVFP